MGICFLSGFVLVNQGSREYCFLLQLWRLEPWTNTVAELSRSLAPCFLQDRFLEPGKYV